MSPRRGLIFVGGVAVGFVAAALYWPREAGPPARLPPAEPPAPPAPRRQAPLPIEMPPAAPRIRPADPGPGIVAPSAPPQPPSPPPIATEAPGPAWTPLASFPQDGTTWVSAGDSCRQEGQAFRLRAASSGVLSFKRLIPGDVRIEVDATIAKAQDVQIFLSAREDPGYVNQPFSGLQCKFGGSDAVGAPRLKSQTMGYIAESREALDLSGRHRLVAERIGGLLRLACDGRECLRLQLPGGAHGDGDAVGIAIWDGDILVHGIRIWTGSHAEPPPTAVEAPPPVVTRPAGAQDF